MTENTRRLKTCIEAWPECATGEYDPRCCRFPKSCSCDIVHNQALLNDPEWREEHLEPERRVLTSGSGLSGHTDPLVGIRLADGVHEEISLQEFLTARLGEERELVRQLIAADVPSRWTERRGEVLGEMTVSLRRIAAIDEVNLGPGGAQLAAEHIARFDPTRMLDEIEAKRAIIAEYVARDEDADLMLGPDCQRQREWSGLRLAVRLLASSYRGHPQWREGWV